MDHCLSQVLPLLVGTHAVVGDMTAYGTHRYRQAARMVDLAKMLWLAWRAWRGDIRAALRLTMLTHRYTKES